MNDDHEILTREIDKLILNHAITEIDQLISNIEEDNTIQIEINPKDNRLVENRKIHNQQPVRDRP